MQTKITRFTALADEVFPEDPKLERICEGYSFSEGPVWDVREECLYFTDFPNLSIYKWSEKKGAAAYREDSNRAIGLTMDSGGRLIAAESASRCIAYTNGQKSRPIIDKYGEAALNSPNDVIIAKNGDILFTDPYSAMLNMPREITYNGVFRATPHGQCSLLYSEMGWPNGIAFSPDESVLYVNDTDQMHILSFEVKADGSVGLPEIFAVLDKSYGPGAPDGMKVDTRGNVYVTGPGGVWVIEPDGAPAAILHSPEFVGNLCFGGADGKTLYLTASSSVYRTSVNIQGIMPHCE